MLRDDSCYAILCNLHEGSTTAMCRCCHSVFISSLTYTSSYRLVSGLLDRDQEVGLMAERVGGLGRYVEYTTSQLSPIELIITETRQIS